MLEIGAGKSHNLSIDMKKEESITWKFRTEERDIGFQVDFKKNNEPSIPCQVIFAYQRLEADKETQMYILLLFYIYCFAIFSFLFSLYFCFCLIYLFIYIIMYI